MTNSTRLFGLIMIAVLSAASAYAQDLPLPGVNAPDLPLPPVRESDLPVPGDEDAMSSTDLSLPALDESGPQMAAPESGDESMLSEPGAVDLESLEGYDPSAAHEYEQFGAAPHDFWAHQPAPIESTGTWLRRGFWYAEAEAVIWNRHWNRDAVFLAAQDPNITNPVFFEFQALGGLGGRFNTNRLLILDGAQPGEDASVRGTLGHFLFRDSRNRDHLLEFTAMGGGDWHQHRRISSQNNFGLFVNFLVSGNNRTFNASTHQQVDYSSTYRSFEWNYRVKQRLRRDQLIMDANGNWHRATNPGFHRDFLVGLRFMELRDILNWTAQDIQAIGNDGSYRIRTDNDMFGFQMGWGFTYETSRWSLGLHSKGGVYLNDALGRTSLDFTVDDDFDADLRLANDELSFIGETKLVARWHLLPDFSFRAAYEMMYVTAQALAPNQMTFINDFAYLNTSQDPFYHGASFGFEGYW
jgi:hypothetical protein